MIGKLTGIIDEVLDNNILLNVNGVSYVVYLPTSYISSLISGNSTSLWIETLVREDSITLFGFINSIDKTIFNLLTTVQGVGPKLALAIMSGLEVDNIVNAILQKNQSTLQQVSGVGAKVATRIVNELVEKVSKMNLIVDGSHSQTNVIKRYDQVGLNAIEALKSLGYTVKQAEQAVDYVLTNANCKIELQQLIKQALNYFNAG